MGRRRDVRERIATLGEIDEILTAMKNLALVEVRRIEAFIRAQRAAVAVIEDTAADFLADRSHAIRATSVERDVLCLIGSERGFCGDFNRRIVEEAAQWQQVHAAHAVVLIGERLVADWSGDAFEAVPGAGVADEVPATLQALVARLPALISDPASASRATGLVAIHHAEEGVRMRRFLPLPDPPTRASPRPYPVELYLSPARFFAQLTDQYVYAALQGALYESLLEENRRRLNHMEQAVHKLREDLERLGRQSNRLRQEEITEEIEVILLNATAPEAPRIGAPPGGPASASQEHDR